MYSRRSFPFVLILVVLAGLSACQGNVETLEPTQPPTTTLAPLTDTPIPSNTPRPTFTPKPTATPDIAATQLIESANARINSYVEKGYLSGTKGELFGLDDYRREMAKIGFLDFGLAGYDNLVSDLAFWGQVSWENAGPVGYPHYSGCGISFRINPENYDGYTAMLTNERVLLTYCDESIHRCGEVGKTRGPGVIKFDNPASAFMEIIVNDTQAFVLVDGDFIGEYTLFKDKLTDPGFFVYSIISGTNKDYGVRCEITDSYLWVAE